MALPIRVSLTTLHCLPIFRDIPDEQLEMIISICRAMEYDQGEPIIKAGEVTNDFYIVLSGKIKVMLKEKSGGKEVVLTYLSGGDFFGELSMIDAEPRSADVIADTDCCIVSMSGPDFRELVRRNVDITFYILKNLASRLRHSDEKIKRFALEDVSTRVLAELISIAKEEGENLVITERVSRQEIAKVVGASREMVGRAIRDLEIKGEFKTRDGKIFLRKRNK